MSTDILNAASGTTHADAARAEAEAERAMALAEDPVFAEEQAHLHDTYETLVRLGKAAAAKLERVAFDAATDKESMASELTHNLATDDDIIEMQAEFAAVNRIIDAYNLSHDLEAERLAAIELLLREPYFAKVVLRFKEGAPAKELYIGNAGISNESYQRIVVDWRSPVAEVYYNQANGRTSYEADGRIIECDLLLRRQFDISGNTLNSYFDTTVAIQDALLLKSLSKRRSAHMQAITATIQREQNVVVRHADVPTLLVAGIAGSGKTSVLLQRVAYLFYQHRDTLEPQDVYLITPNALFERYIAGVLPDLGERNPNTLTWQAFASRLLPEGRGVGDKPVALERLEAIERAMQDFEFEPEDFRGIFWGERKLIGADQIRKLSDRFAGVPAGPHRVTLMREELHTRLEGRLKALAAEETVQMEVQELSIEEQLALFNEVADPQTEEEERALALIYLTKQCAFAFEDLEKDRWIDIDRIGRRLTGTDGLSGVEWLYVYMLVTGVAGTDAQYVFVDEVQDYTLSQLLVLARYFRRAKFLLLGDPNQAILEGTATFPQIRDLFAKARGDVSECFLMTSYRSTPEITALFATLAGNELGLEISSVQREDSVPRVQECADDASWADALRDAVRHARRQEGLTAVITSWKSEVKRVAAALAPLGEDAPVLLDESATLPESGVVLMTLKLAKGLEFDRVIVADASARLFGENDLSRHRLYTAISRATREVTILSRGPMTPLLDTWRKRD